MKPRTLLTILGIAGCVLAEPAVAVTQAYGTYFGDGTPIAQGNVVADGAGRVYFAGATTGAGLPVTSGAYQATPGALYVACFDLTTRSLAWCTYLGPAVASGYGPSLAWDPAGALWVGTSAVTPDWPVIDAPQPAMSPSDGTSSPQDAWVGKLDASGSRLLKATYFGGTGAEWLERLAVAPDGSLVLAGRVIGGALPTVNAFQDSGSGSIDVFVTRLTPDATSISFSTYLQGGEDVHGLAVGPDGAVHACGFTRSQDFPCQPCIPGTFAPSPLGESGFLTVLEPTGNCLRWSQPFGNDLAALAVDGAGRIIVVGDGTIAEPGTVPTDTTGFGHRATLARLLPDGAIDLTTQLNSVSCGSGWISLEGSDTVHVVLWNTGIDAATPDALQPTRPASRLAPSTVQRVVLGPGAPRVTYSSYVGGQTRTSPPAMLAPNEFTTGATALPDGSTAIVGLTDYDDVPTTTDGLMPTTPHDVNGQARRQAFLHVTGPSLFVNAHEPSAVDLNPGVVPLQVHRSGMTQVIVGWEETLGDKDAIYVGHLQNLHGGSYDYTPMAGGCDLLNPVFTFPLPDFDCYFVATSRIGTVESSYGRDSFERERPPSSSPCR